MSALLEARLRLALEDFVLDCDFTIGDEAVVLFGRSGAGKSSILDCLAGFRQPQQGEITLHGRPLFRSSEGVHLPPRERRIGYLAQKPALFPHMTVRQNVEYGLLDRPSDERHERARQALEQFEVATLASRTPSTLSGGEQQRVALARTLVREPGLLLLDEPLSGLDQSLKSLLLEAIFDWRRRHNTPLLYVTHDLEEAYSLARKVLLLEAGRIIGRGEPRELFRAPVSRQQAASAGYENLLEARVEERDESSGTMRCRLLGAETVLEAPLAERRAGEGVLLALRAGDILLATKQPHGLSARNLLEATITHLEERPAMDEVRALSGGTEFVAHITRGSRQRLGLRAGQPIWLVIKTHSIHLLRPDL